MSKYFSMIRQKSSQICSLNVQKSFNGFFAAKYAEYSIVPIILQQPIDAVIWIWIIFYWLLHYTQNQTLSVSRSQQLSLKRNSKLNLTTWQSVEIFFVSNFSMNISARPRSDARICVAIFFHHPIRGLYCSQLTNNKYCPWLCLASQPGIVMGSLNYVPLL